MTWHAYWGRTANAMSHACVCTGYSIIQCVPLATEPGISLIILPLMRILQQLRTHTIDTFLFISHTTNVLLFKFRCNIFIGVRIIKEMPGSVASGTHCPFDTVWSALLRTSNHSLYMFVVCEITSRSCLPIVIYRNLTALSQPVFSLVNERSCFLF